MSKAKFYSECPKTRKEFVAEFRNNKVFRTWAEYFGFNVIGENVIFPDGQFVADIHVK